jgi:hypothetical protein
MFVAVAVRNYMRGQSSVMRFRQTTILGIMLGNDESSPLPVYDLPPDYGPSRMNLRPLPPMEIE